MSERRLAFGQVAELYDRARPAYPATLVDDVLEFAGAGPHDRILEVGAGTGKATTLFAACGATVVAIEPSPAMAAIARRNCEAFDRVQIEQAEFEHWDPPEGGFRLLFSAQAWHWVAPQQRYVRARAALEPGGALAVFWNRPRWSGCPLRDELKEAYAREAPDFGPRPGPMHPASDNDPELWGDWTREIGCAQGFGRPATRSYTFSCAYSSDEYVRLLQTHSDHILLDEPRRSALLTAVRDVIDRHGGTLLIEYETTLWLARADGSPRTT